MCLIFGFVPASTRRQFFRRRAKFPALMVIHATMYISQATAPLVFGHAPLQVGAKIGSKLPAFSLYLLPKVIWGKKKYLWGPKLGTWAPQIGRMFSSECNRAFIHLVEDKVKSFQEPEHLMIPMGNDFHYQDASINYRNMDKAMPALPFLLEAHFPKEMRSYAA